MKYISGWTVLEIEMFCFGIESLITSKEISIYEQNQENSVLVTQASYRVR